MVTYLILNTQVNKLNCSRCGSTQDMLVTKDVIPQVIVRVVEREMRGKGFSWLYIYLMLNTQAGKLNCGCYGSNMASVLERGIPF